MLANTFVVTVYEDGQTVQKTLTRINSDGSTGKFRLGTALYELVANVRHTKTKATASKPSLDRHNVELVQTIYATATKAEYTRKVYFVLEAPPSDLDTGLAFGLVYALTHTTGATPDQLLAWES